MSALVRVTIDDRTVEVPAGTLITEAARMAEVHIPVFCSHDKLQPLGACRICVAEVGTPKLGADRKPVIGADGKPEIAWMPKVQATCTLPVSEGMVVRTQSPPAVKARQGVMEFLLVNHPLDCPVCDEGGECQLQDLAFAFGQDFSRMDQPKRTFESEDLGPIVKKEANRCIVCMRCVRYCDEVMGEDALTAHQRGVRTEISSFDRQPLACEQCGNCIEVCPVGALTALPYRFKARPWDLRQHITVCPWCSNGCSVRLGVRGMEILRARGTEFRGVNAEFLCVRGRFGYEYVNAADRLGSPLVRQGGALQPATFDTAVAETAARLRDIAAAHGPASIAILGGERLNVEEQYLLQKLARGVLGTPNVDARTRYTTRVSGTAILKATGGGRPALTFEDLYAAQETLVLFDDLQGESPFAQATAIRGQHQKGQHITVAHARRVKLTRSKFKSDWLGVAPGAELALLNALTRSALDLGDPADLPAEVAAGLPALKAALAAWTPERITSETGVPAAAVAAAAKRLREAGRKAVLFGRAVAEHPQAPALLQAIENLGWATGALTASRSSVMYAGPQSDSQGALDMGLAPDVLPGYTPVGDAAARGAFEKAWGGKSLPGTPGLSAPEVLDAVIAGKVRALWIVSDHWLASAPDRAKAEQALAKAEFVVVNELFLTDTAKQAHVVFPVASFAEKDGAVTNCERRVQKATRALSPRRGTKADWEVLQLVAQALGADWRYRTAEDVYREIARLVPGYEQTSWATLLPDGFAWSAARVAGSLAVADAAKAAGEGLWLLAGGTLFAQGSLSARSATLTKLHHGPRAYLGNAEASRLGLGAGDRVELAGPAGTLVLPFEMDDSVPANAVFVPYALADGGLGRLGAPAGAGLRVKVRKVAATATVGA